MNKVKIYLLMSISPCLGGCALVAPSFDVPRDEAGFPYTNSITQRIRCELIKMVRDTGPGKNFPQRQYIIDNDYQFSGRLYLDTTNKAGIAPSLSFLDTTKYMFGLNGQADLSRKDSLSVVLSYSLNTIARDDAADPEAGNCPNFDGNLSGDLGLARSVAIALSTPGVEKSTSVSPDSGEVSGTIEFISNIGVTSAGPTWAFKDFKGPGEFASATRAYTNRLTYGMASGKNARTQYNAAIRARQLVQEQIQSDFAADLSGIRNAFR